MTRVSGPTSAATLSSPTSTGGALRAGSQGPEVEALQRALTAAGFPAEPDGKFGPETRKAVIAFQKANGLPQTGVAAEKTQAKLAQAPSGATATGGAWGTPSRGAGWGAQTAAARPAGQAASQTQVPVQTATIATPGKLAAPKNAREAAVDAIPEKDLVLGGTAAAVKRTGETTLGNKLPIVKGSYDLVADYTNPGSNHLYVVDKRDHSIVARYVSNGGQGGATPGGPLKVNFKNTRPTWTPTQNELRENKDFAADGPGPESSMGLVKLNLKGAVYIHGVWDAQTDGNQVSIDKDQIDDLGSAHSHGCWNMSNPNVVELVEKFGIGEGAKVTVLKGAAGKGQAQKLAQQMAEEKLGDRPLSAGTDILAADYAGEGKYLSKKNYTDKGGTKQTDDGWYLRLWQRREKAGV